MIGGVGINDESNKTSLALLMQISHECFYLGMYAKP